jgi:hypothetical protein
VSEIERHLDELFDRMAGQGAAGRRALIETEDHLRAVATDAMAQGLPADQAEHEAVTRFGSPAMVARKMRSAHGAGRLNQASSAGWLLAGLAAAGLGMSYLLAAGRLGWRSPACNQILASSCYSSALRLVDATTSAAIAAAAGATLLIGRWLAVRYAGLAPARRGFALAAGLVLALAAIVIGTADWAPALHFLLLRPGTSFIVTATALIECLAAAVSLADSRPRRCLP